MSLKFGFLLLAVIAIVYGLPASDDAEKSDLKSLAPVPDVVDRYLNSLLPGDGELSVVMQPVGGEGSTLSRQRRACRTIKIRTKSGRVITVKRC